MCSSKRWGLSSQTLVHCRASKGLIPKARPRFHALVWEELGCECLIHRGLLHQRPVRVLVFADRVEVVSPGHLPNNLTVENVKAGNSNMRNPILASFAAKLLPYAALGSGLLRSLRACLRSNSSMIGRVIVQGNRDAGRSEPGGVIDRTTECQCCDDTDPWHSHQPAGVFILASETAICLSSFSCSVQTCFGAWVIPRKLAGFKSGFSRAL